ncbi:MAG: hypothetical protein ACK50J_26645 [Planctomyces sp.]
MKGGSWFQSYSASAFGQAVLVSCQQQASGQSPGVKVVVSEDNSVREKQMVIRFVTGPALMAAGLIVALSDQGFAGGLLHGAFHHGSDCGCSGPSPAVYAAPIEYSGLEVAGCCGAGGLGQIGGLYGADALYGGGSFMSGYEGLPNMDGGGVHYRYPYHSYRRPWAHPGPPSTNVSIVW